MNEILTAITTVGFPIVMCGGLGWYIKYTHDHHRADILQLNAEHKAETELLSTAINNNTLVMQQIVDAILEQENNINEK